MMPKRALAASALAAVAGFAGAAAQQPVVQTPVPLVRENATTKLASHTYVIPDNDVPLVPNVGIVTGSRGTLVIDTGLGARNGETIMREVRKVSTNASLYVAVTHVHPEHDLGAHGFPAGAKMVRSRAEDQDIAEFGLQLADTFAKRSTVTADLLKGATYRKTDISFDREYALDLGSAHVWMLAVGPTHTRGDTVFFVDEDRVLFAGDVVMSAFPAFASPYSSVSAWVAALDRLAALNPAVVVPSHGKLVEATMIARYRDYLRAVQGRARDLKAQGKSADEAAQTIQTELQGRYGDMAQPARIAGAARAAYREAR